MRGQALPEVRLSLPPPLLQPAGIQRARLQQIVAGARPLLQPETFSMTAAARAISASAAESNVKNERIKQLDKPKCLK